MNMNMIIKSGRVHVKKADGVRVAERSCLNTNSSIARVRNSIVVSYRLPMSQFGRVDMVEGRAAFVFGEHLHERFAQSPREQHRARERGVQRALRERAERTRRFAQTARQFARVIGGLGELEQEQRLQTNEPNEPLCSSALARALALALALARCCTCTGRVLISNSVRALIGLIRASHITSVSPSITTHCTYSTHSIYSNLILLNKLMIRR